MTCRASHWKLKRIEISWLIYAILVLCSEIITTEFIIVSYQHDVPLRSHEKPWKTSCGKPCYQNTNMQLHDLHGGEGSKKCKTAKIFSWGAKQCLRHPKKNPLESVVFYGPCNSLETKPSISVVFASFWKWSLSPVRFLQDIGPRNRAFAGLDAAVSTAPATLWSSNLWFSMVALKLTLV